MKESCAMGYTGSKDGTGGDYEPQGEPGDKGEGGSAGAPSGVDETGTNSAQNALLSALNAQHGRPAVSATPENATGSPMPGNPTAAEGAKEPYAI